MRLHIRQPRVRFHFINSCAIADAEIRIIYQNAVYRAVYTVVPLAYYYNFILCIAIQFLLQLHIPSQKGQSLSRCKHDTVISKAQSLQTHTDYKTVLQETFGTLITDR